MGISSECDFTVDINAEGVGTSLRRMRELRELTKEEVAHRLRLQHAVIELMESGSFPGNLPEIFAKGYLKSYARLLQFSDADVLLMLESLKFHSPLYNAAHFANHGIHKDSSSRSTYLLTGLVVLIMIALLAVWLEPSLYEALSKIVAPLIASLKL